MLGYLLKSSVFFLIINQDHTFDVTIAMRKYDYFIRIKGNGKNMEWGLCQKAPF